jgi:hypothetical protein
MPRCRAKWWAGLFVQEWIGGTFSLSLAYAVESPSLRLVTAHHRAGKAASASRDAAPLE